jgi:crotonobetainyl-CoA:carnitine CoA-transferase CaiB-like acyl-CoA transferase
MSADEVRLPLSGIRVLEFTHMLMGPAAGAVLADLGAEVIRIEPPGGDPTRVLPGSGAGYFSMFNRNKRSVGIDIKSPRGRELALELVRGTDALIENFKPGTMERLGLGYERLAAENPRLVYCSTKGFLSGPYEQRSALDEVAQMMGGLAWMTGLPGRPMRAGASVNDIMGGMFGALAILAALEERRRTGRGQRVRSALFENVAYLMGQHLAQEAVTGRPVQPMSVRVSAWAVYDIFDTRDGSQVFLGIVSDGQWRAFCAAFDLQELGADPSLADNAGRVSARPRIIPLIRERLAGFDKAVLMKRFEAIAVPFAPVAAPRDLWTDPHLAASGGMSDTRLPDGRSVPLPLLPVEMDGRRFGLRLQPPAPGEHTVALLAALGLGDAAIADLAAQGVVGIQGQSAAGAST